MRMTNAIDNSHISSLSYLIRKSFKSMLEFNIISDYHSQLKTTHAMKLLLLLAVGVAASAEDVEDFSSHNRFTADVYKEVKKTTSNSFMTSPLSIDVLLALLHGGAKGKTAQELAKGLYLPDNDNRIGEIFTKVSAHLKGSADYELSSANKVFLQKGFQISENFKSRAVGIFNAEVQNIDLSKPENAAAEINGWVLEKTHDKIRDLIAPNDLLGNPASVVVNALYFSGKWETQFEVENTEKKEFHLNANDTVEVDMMQMTDGFNRFESPELKAKFLQMPYQGENVNMVLVLPDDIEGLPALEDRIHEVLATPLSDYGSTIIKIPKFIAETAIQFNPILQALGIKEPFSSSADFSGIGANQEPLQLSKVIQKAFIEVEEAGTRAASASGGVIHFLSSNYKPPPPMNFTADRPFLYYIKIKGAIVFIGRYSGPK